MVGGMAPDLDIFIRSDTDPLLALEFHRQFTHSLFFIPLGGLICALVLHPLWRHRLALRETYLFTTVGYATHGLLDACTTYGTLLLWPFSYTRFAWNSVSVVDPLFTIPALLLVAASAIFANKNLARIAMVWMLGYLLLGFIQHQRAVNVGFEISASRGHQPTRLEAKPAFANILLWKIVYLHEDRFYVDAVRVGPLGHRVYPGDSVAKLDIARDLPWLDLKSQQARDIERFRWFSNDYLAMDRGRADFVVDMRYSLLPNEIDALWGIQLSRAAGADTHVRYAARRSVTPERRAKLIDMLLDR